jgi:hypothetical protein
MPIKNSACEEVNFMLSNDSALLDDQVQTSLRELVATFAADEVTMEIGQVRDSTLEITLIFGAETCEECVLPADRLSQLIGFKLAQDNLSEIKLVIRDPRVAGE